MDKIVIASDSHFMNNSIKSLIKIPSQIIKHILDIVNLVKHFVNIQLGYCNMSQNSLPDRIAKKSHCTLKLLFYINGLFLLKKKKEKKPEVMHC